MKSLVCFSASTVKTLVVFLSLFSQALWGQPPTSGGGSPQIKDDFFLEGIEEEQTTNKWVMGSVMTLTGTVGYFSGVVVGAASSAAFCSACVQFSETDNAVRNVSVVLGTTFVTGAFVSGTATLFEEPGLFWHTTTGAFLGSLAFPAYFYSAQGATGDRFDQAFLVAAGPTVFGALLGYFLGGYLFPPTDAEAETEKKVSIHVGNSGNYSYLAVSHSW